MIQFNLLPDVKIEFIKARRLKRMIMVISGLAAVVSVALLIVMFSVAAFQRKHVADLKKDITAAEKQLTSTPDLAKILTIQNQLNSLPALYAQRPVMSRLLGYVQSTTPKGVSLSHLVLSFDDMSMKVEGTADTLELVNTYVDTLKFTTYSVKDSGETPNAFSGVVLTTFNRTVDGASYSITMTFDGTIFNSDKAVTLNVPTTITTRSETELPSNGVFDAKGTTK